MTEHPAWDLLSPSERDVRWHASSLWAAPACAQAADDDPYETIRTLQGEVRDLRQCLQGMRALMDAQLGED